MSDALSRRRNVTQSVARWAYEESYQGIVYTSRLDAAFDCWAIFEGATYEILSTSAIVRDDPDLLAIAEIFALRLVE